MNNLPHAIAHIESIQSIINDRTPVLFLDFDGTLAPIVKNPEDAMLTAEIRETISSLRDLIPVAVVSGRDRADVKEKIGLENLIYAGSHGFDIVGPGDMHLQFEGGVKALAALDKAEDNLKVLLEGVDGVKVERKKYAIAVHFRNVAKDQVTFVKEMVARELEKHGELREGTGKAIIELKPDVDWHKGKAILWIMETLGYGKQHYAPFFIGDDITDEDALKVVKEDGVGILVDDHGEETAAAFGLNDPEDVAVFLKRFLTELEETTIK